MTPIQAKSSRSISVHLLPSTIPPGALDDRIAVVVDVLRATTVMVRALAAGAQSIRPCMEIDEARNLAASMDPEKVLLAGERNGVPINGFDLGNTPDAMTPERSGGKTVVMSTTNGTRAIRQAAAASRVLVASWENLDATVEALDNDSRPIALIGSGTDNRVSYEDALLLAGMLSALLKRWFPAGEPPPTVFGNDEALVLFPTAQRFEVLDQPRSRYLRSEMGKSRGGRRITELGLSKDIDAAAGFSGNSFELVAELQLDPVKIIALPRISQHAGE